MEKTEKFQYNLTFGFGVVFSVVGAIFDLWYLTIFGLIVMITIRWIEKDKEEKNE